MIPIIDPVDRTLILKELTADKLLRKTNNGGNEIYVVTARNSPNIMQELGRLRELSFRDAGGGTGATVDIDAEDTAEEGYQQLFVWDPKAQEIVGGYRFIVSRTPHPKHMSTEHYFRFSDKFRNEFLPYTIELGRSFIVNEYQRKPVSLMLLWKGILNVLLRHDEFRYLMGPVTISGEFQNSSKLLIAAYLRNRHLDRENARHIHPRTGIAVPARIDGTLIEGIDSIELINKIVCDIEQNRFTIPILIRKYLQVGARVLGFNTDHAFCDGLDALILVDLAQVPEKTILMLSKEMTDIDVIGRFSRYRPTIPESSPPAEPTIPA